MNNYKENYSIYVITFAKLCYWLTKATRRSEQFASNQLYYFRPDHDPRLACAGLYQHTHQPILQSSLAQNDVVGKTLVVPGKKHLTYPFIFKYSQQSHLPLYLFVASPHAIHVILDCVCKEPRKGHCISFWWFVITRKQSTVLLL